MVCAVVAPSGTHRRVLKNCLQCAGYENVRSYRSGERVLDDVMDGEVDLVVTRRSLPRISGLDLTRSIRAYDAQRDTCTPVIVAGEGFDRDAVVEAIRAGAAQIVVLPVLPEIMAVKVDAALGICE